MTILVTGGFGFIGSNFVINHLLKFPEETVVVLDKLTYAANPRNLEDVVERSRLVVYRGDINNEELMANILSAHSPRAIINFAAESHVDRSIAGPAPFIQTNIVGVATLLEMARQYADYRATLKQSFRFLQVGTDEVYGSLLANSPASVEYQTPYAPRSPYSASKAAADFLCKAYWETYGTPVLLTTSCNNYGPRQHQEKFIPTAIFAAAKNKKIPVYGTGANIREWIHVDDNCEAIEAVLEKGKPGQQYHIGGAHTCDNLALAHRIAHMMNDIDEEATDEQVTAQYVEFVKDRAGHDYRYALNSDKIREELGWEPRIDFETGLKNTIDWYKTAYAL